MGKFDHLDKLQIQAELRRIELVPQKFLGSDVQELRDRLAKILEDERQAEIDRDERKHGEVIAAARRSRSRAIGVLCFRAFRAFGGVKAIFGALYGFLFGT